MSKFQDLTGQRFGRLVVIERVEDYIRPNGQSQVQWRCKCDCGNEKITIAYSLTHGLCTSCGCARTERIVNMNYEHGQSNSSLYRRWQHMKDRCYNPNDKRYKNYGRRGIKVCDEWLNSFENFYNWAINNGYQEGLTIDRIDVDGNYEPSNCRWVTTKEQQFNKRNNKRFFHDGKNLTLPEWSEILHISLDTLVSRIYTRGWNVERALTEPVHTQSRNKKAKR